MPADLAQDTRVEPAGAGCYRAELPHHWDYELPSGGAVMTVGLRALEQALGNPDFALRSATIVFLAPVLAGPIEVRVHTLRAGNVASQMRAEMRAGGVASAEILATFGAPRAGFELESARFPELPMPAEAWDCSEPHPQNPHLFYRLFGNLDVRLARGTPWWKGPIAGGQARLARWFRYRVPQRRADGHFDPLALPPLADTMAGALHQGIGGEPRFYAPSLDLTLHFIEPTLSEWILASVHLRRAHGGYASAEVEMWSEDKKLIGYGTQMMIYRRPKEIAR